MKLVGVLAAFVVIAGVLAIDDLVCPKNHTVLETAGDAVLSVFIDTDYGPECNITTPKSIQEVATAVFVVQTLNKMEFVPGVTIGMRLYDTCNDRISVYKQALISAVEMDCSAHYDLGILAPQRYYEVLEPLRSLDVLPVNTYSPPNLTLPLVDVLVDFVSTRYATIDLLLSSSRYVLDHFLNESKEAGICVKSDKELELDAANGTAEVVVVALGDYEDMTAWLDDQEDFGDEYDRRVWIVLPLDNSYVDDLLPEGSYVIKPEQFAVDLGGELDQGDVSQVPSDVILRSPHLLSVGKAIVEIAKVLQELQSKSCAGVTPCVLPRFDLQERKAISNVDLYETLRVPAMSHTTRYTVHRKVDGVLTELNAYKIDATSARFRAVAEKETTRLSKLCVKKQAKNCQRCVNFLIQEMDDVDRDDEDEIGTLKPFIWVPIFLTILSCGSLACLVVLAFIIYRFLIDDILDGNPALTVCLIFATLMMLQSIVPFCLEDKTIGAEHLNARKIFVSTLSFGLAFSIMLTRALFLAFSTGGLFSAHINGYLQGLMAFFMGGVQVAISTMYFILSDDDSAKVMRSPVYIALLSYDIFLLVLLFITCCFIAQEQRNYREGICFFVTAVAIIMCWAVWLTCFFLMSAYNRDVIVCYGILGTACLIIIGILVPRTYFMCAHMTREKNVIGRFEVSDLGPDPRMNNMARQALDLQSRQPFYEYVSSPGVQQQQQQLQQPAIANYYGTNASPSRNSRSRFSLRRRSPEPRRTPGYNNYGFRPTPEMREVVEGAYVIPRLCVEDSDVSRAQAIPARNVSVSEVGSVREARYSLPKSLLRRMRASKQRMPVATVTLAGEEEEEEAAAAVYEERVTSYGRPMPTEVYVQDRLTPARQGPDERYPRRSSSPKLTPTHASIREEEEMDHAIRITRF